MDKQYRELTLHQALDEKIAFKELQCSLLDENEWGVSVNESVSPLLKYRIEIEAPKQGDEIQVSSLGGSVATGVFIGMDGDKFVVKDKQGGYCPWPKAETIKPCKSVAREGWVHPFNIYSDKCDGFIYVREITGEGDE